MPLTIDSEAIAASCRQNTWRRLCVGGGQAGLTMSHMLGRRGVATLVARKGPHRRALANGTLGWVALPVSELVSGPAGLSVSARRSRRLRDQPGDRRVPDGYADFVRAPVRWGVTVTALASARTARDSSRTPQPVRSARHCRRRDRPLSAGRCSPDLIGEPALSGSRQRLPGAWPVAIRRGAGRRLGGLGYADRRGTVARERRVFLSVGRHRSMPRRYRGCDLIWWREKWAWTRPRRPSAGRTGVATDYGRLRWPYDRFSPARGTRYHLARPADPRRTVRSSSARTSPTTLPSGTRLRGFLDSADAFAARQGIAMPDDLTPALRTDPAVSWRRGGALGSARQASAR